MPAENDPTTRIDAHVHGDPKAFQGDPKAYVEAWRARGLEAAVLIESLEECLAAVRAFGDFIIPCPRIEMDDCSARDVEACFKAGCPAVKFIRPAAPYADERYWPLYEMVEQQGKTAVFHTGYLGFRQREERPVQMEHMRAAQIEVISRRFPEMKILMAHFSNPWWEEAWKVMWTKKNVYADLSGGTAYRRSLNMWGEMFAPNGDLMADAVAKLVCASDASLWTETENPMEPFFSFYDKLYDRLNLSDELRERVNRGNAEALFAVETLKHGT